MSNSENADNSSSSPTTSRESSGHRKSGAKRMISQKLVKRITEELIEFSSSDDTNSSHGVAVGRRERSDSISELEDTRSGVLITPRAMDGMRTSMESHPPMEARTRASTTSTLTDTRTRITDKQATLLGLSETEYAGARSQQLDLLFGKTSGAPADKQSPPQLIITLDDILQNESHRNLFRMFCAHTHCSENLKFYERIETLKADMPKGELLNAQCDHIINTFLLPDSPYEIALGQRTVKRVLSIYSDKTTETTVELFDRAQQECLALINFSSYPRYITYLTKGASQRMSTPQTSPTESPRGAPAAVVPPPANNVRGRRGTLYQEVPTMREIFDSKRLFRDFLEYASSVHCEESLSFYQRIQHFRMLTGQDELNSDALQIWEQYLSASSETELNIGSKVRSRIKYEIEEGLVTPALYKWASREVYKLISLDIYPKFVSNVFQPYIDHQ